MADPYSTKIYQAMGGGQAVDNRQVLSADGSTSAVSFVGPARLSLTGNFGTGTAQLQVRDPSSATISVANGSFTAATDTIFDFPAHTPNTLNVDLAGSSAPALVVWIQSGR